jgi:hypothetical protein
MDVGAHTCGVMATGCDGQPTSPVSDTCGKGTVQCVFGIQMMRSNTKASIEFPLLRAIDFNVIEKKRIYWAVNTGTVPDIQDLTELSVHNGYDLFALLTADLLMRETMIQRAMGGGQLREFFFHAVDEWV